MIRRVLAAEVVRVAEEGTGDEEQGAEKAVSGLKAGKVVGRSRAKSVRRNGSVEKAAIVVNAEDRRTVIEKRRKTKRTKAVRIEAEEIAEGGQAAGVAREVRVKEAVKAAAVGEVKGRAEETAAGKVVEVAVVKIKDKAAGKAQEIRAAIHGREAIREIREEMGKDKLRKFAENLTFENLVQPEFDEIFGRDHKLKGHWAADFFGNDKPIVLELGCGKGEYTVGMGAANPEKNFMGIDIKGARMWRGAKTATEMGLGNVGFLRTRIEFIGSFFAPGEIAEIWITFPDPQLKKGREKKRLTAPGFLDRYRAFLVPGGMVHLKTDSRELHDYTLEVVAEQGLELHCASADIYGEGLAEVYSTLQIKTAYERRFLTEGKPITYLSISLK